MGVKVGEGRVSGLELTLDEDACSIAEMVSLAASEDEMLSEESCSAELAGTGVGGLVGLLVVVADGCGVGVFVALAATVGVTVGLRVEVAAMVGTAVAV